MWLYELVKENEGIYLRERMIDKRTIKDRFNISVKDENYENLCKEDVRYGMANFVLTLNDGSKVFGR